MCSAGSVRVLAHPPARTGRSRGWTYPGLRPGPPAETPSPAPLRARLPAPGAGPGSSPGLCPRRRRGLHPQSEGLSSPPGAPPRPRRGLRPRGPASPPDAGPGSPSGLRPAPAGTASPVEGLGSARDYSAPPPARTPSPHPCGVASPRGGAGSCCVGLALGTQAVPPSRGCRGVWVPRRGAGCVALSSLTCNRGSAPAGRCAWHAAGSLPPGRRHVTESADPHAGLGCGRRTRSPCPAGRRIP